MSLIGRNKFKNLSVYNNNIKSWIKDKKYMTKILANMSNNTSKIKIDKKNLKKIKKKYITKNYKEAKHPKDSKNKIKE